MLFLKYQQNKIIFYKKYCFDKPLRRLLSINIVFEHVTNCKLTGLSTEKSKQLGISLAPEITF